MEIGSLAVLLGESLDSEGVRQSLMAQELADLPAESLAHALDCWKRGDKRHLSTYQQDATRVGVFFPRPAELREIAQLHARETREREREQARQRQQEAEERHRQEHPEEYCSIGDLVGDLYAKQEAKTAPRAPRDKQHCDDKTVQLSGLSPADLRALADALERQAQRQDPE